MPLPRLLSLLLAPVLGLQLTAIVSPAGPIPPCDANSGLSVPAGFCAIVVGSRLGPVRHLVIAPDGDLFAAMGGGNGGVLALRDTDGDGHADVEKRFGPDGGTGIAFGDHYLYFATDNRIVRWRMEDGDLTPRGPMETVVRGLPDGGDHTAKTLALGPGNVLYVDFGSATNSCQASNRSRRSAGHDPCTELETRAGIWRFAADRLDQRPKDGVRFATGLRNAMALAVQPGTDQLFAATHGRDQLGENWGFTDEQNAELPAEEFVRATKDANFGWPYCYYDGQAHVKVLAPEYGGDGKQVGRCASMAVPLIGFPGHWAPLALTFYDSGQFPPEYRGGAFLAFHGSWNRAPLPQSGYRVVFIPFENDKPVGTYTTFASSTAGSTGLRASGLAVGPDGSLYLAADRNGTIWRIVHPTAR
jgi:glucose/arabinose dehydrogenase